MKQDNQPKTTGSVKVRVYVTGLLFREAAVEVTILAAVVFAVGVAMGALLN